MSAIPARTDFANECIHARQIGGPHSSIGCLFSIIDSYGINQVLIAPGYHWKVADYLRVEAELRLPCELSHLRSALDPPSHLTDQVHS